MAEYRTIGLPEDLFRVADGSFDLDVRQTTSDTFLSPGVRVGGLTHQLWRCTLNFVPNARAGWQKWQAFRAKLAGQAVLFIVRKPVQVLPLGAGAGFATTNAELVITGVTISDTKILQGATSAHLAEAAARYAEAVIVQFPTAVASTVVLKAGDVFGLGGNLYLCVCDVTADSAAKARVSFRAPLWKAAVKGDIVTFDKPTCRMQLAGPNEGGVELSGPSFGQFGMGANEVPFI